MFEQALSWIIANPDTTAIVIGLVLSLLSALCQAFGWTRVSKVLGTVTFDGGRVVRYAQRVRKIRALVTKGSAVSLLALVVACSAVPAKTPRADRVIDIARDLVDVTDAALATAIKAKPDGDWEKSVEALEAADAVVRKTDTTIDQVCDEVPKIAAVATLVECSQCGAIADTLRRVVCQ